MATVILLHILYENLQIKKCPKLRENHMLKPKPSSDGMHIYRIRIILQKVESEASGTIGNKIQSMLMKHSKVKWKTTFEASRVFIVV